MSRSLCAALVLLVALSGACSRRETPAPAPRPAATAPTFHGGPAAHPNDWCGSHGVPESECTRCNPELIPQFQARHDWCGEHSVPESQCAACHPELLRQGVAAPRPRGAPPTPAEQGEHGDRTPRSDASAGLAPGTMVRLASPTVAAQVGLETVTATTRPLTDEVAVPARLAFDATRLARVSARVPGVVRTVAVGVGTVVRPGDLLLTLDSAAAAATRADVEAARTRTRISETALQRARTLQAEGIGSLASVERAEAEHAAARASFAGFVAAGTAVSGTGRAVRVLSPRAGVVVARAAAVGQQVTAEEVLVEVADLSRMWAILDVPDAQAPRLSVGQSVAIELDGFAAPLVGTIAFLAPVVDPHTRTVEARVELANPDGRLRANAFGRARVTVAAASEGVVLPRDALQRVEAQDVVFVERAPAVYEARVVTIARRSADGVLLREGGVAPGDRVVTTGGFELKTEILRGSIGAGCCDEG
ncbi:MAG: efflux RND transporter periplasmic adaptor subunit [Deltaproteobacteria bacterium]|nr:efflux RND transporter periplasmic adaptor subunit [Deltaproteobacteria bacterium]